MSSRRIVLVGFPGFMTLDVAGPFDVFGLASRTLQQAAPDSAPAYEVELAGLRSGPITSSTGLMSYATCGLSETTDSIDTILIAGGRGAHDACNNEPLLAALLGVAPHVRRIGSVCTGAFVLAAAGLLDGRRATTHWEAASDLAARYPRVDVEADAIFLKDGSVYTSAGVTAGIDLALALVEEDHGRELALAVARTLVVFARRPGGQTQFSAQLAAQFASEEGIRAVQRWMIDNPQSDLSIHACARRAGMSPRNFARVFSREVGVTPASWVEGMRVERARALLVETERSIEEVASSCGFGAAETMRRAFLRRVRVPPSTYRERFRMRNGERFVLSGAGVSPDKLRLVRSGAAAE
jgi:transcriptional regulator GlxA family with amidase domain